MKKLMNTLYVTSENSYLLRWMEKILLFTMTEKSWGECRYIIWKESCHLDIGEPARRLWEPVRTEIFLSVI